MSARHDPVEVVEALMLPAALVPGVVRAVYGPFQTWADWILPALPWLAGLTVFVVLAGKRFWANWLVWLTAPLCFLLPPIWDAMEVLWALG